MGEMIEFPANGRTCPGYLAKPASGQGKGVVVIQEWWGLNSNIRNIADRFAGEGFVALAPDLYHGKVTSEPDEAGKLMMAMRIDEAEKDLRGAIRYLKELTGGPVGTVGFCMGGALSLFAACKAGADVGACVDFYGGHPAVTYDWDNLTAPVLGIWAEHDDFVNPNVPRYEEELKRRGKRYEFVTYPGTHHAFFNDERPGIYDPRAAEDSWRRVLAFFRQHL
ncbi:MAG: dienelactone hydrolase family protein [Chloroflexota bacterium]|jgi:carboxymethylenebutenolidase|nr:dienelactone hydrolase family protein [Dehalococcoidia bacterium]MDW8046586.1 dienelactone hydrolase family protein [Chloroflexota bacterium]